jgi:DNA helicase-4
MKIGMMVWHLRRLELGVGEVSDVYADGYCKVVFENKIFSGIPPGVLGFLSNGTPPETIKKIVKQIVINLILEQKLEKAEYLYSECKSWWDRTEYENETSHIKENLDQCTLLNEKKKEKIKRKILYNQIISHLDLFDFTSAERIYNELCSSWWGIKQFKKIRQKYEITKKFIEIFNNAALIDLDDIYSKIKCTYNFPLEDYIHIKVRKIQKKLAILNIKLDEEQTIALARPESRLLITARAGAGKTRTLCAHAALTINDEKINPNKILILAFNRSAANEVKKRISIPGYNNARTFHSLACMLGKPIKKDIIFDTNGEPSDRKQSQFVQRLLLKIINPAFKELMYQFFKKELEQIEGIGRDLPPKEYFIFRRNLKHVTLSGDKVKSNGEKFIADFLFEHNIIFKYERIWDWKKKLSDGSIYRPDFSIIVDGRDFILEHWAIDPADPNSYVPDYFKISSNEYRQQINDKRMFWESARIPLIETHAGMLRDGRKEFEARLSIIFNQNGIFCKKLSHEELVEKVINTEYFISQLAKLFLQFIQRSKKRCWSPEDVADIIYISDEKEERIKIFHQLALRAYREYENALSNQCLIDYDDLLLHATKHVESQGQNACIRLEHENSIAIRDLRVIMIDEFQDFSELFFRMINAILCVNPEVRLVAVGDDWQAINSFAGSNLCYFNQFDKHFPMATSTLVSINYRSDKVIVNAGNKLMFGYGKPAKSILANSGFIRINNINDIWVEFRNDEKFKNLKESDSIYFLKKYNISPTEFEKNQAKALKFCTGIILERMNESILIISRMNKIFGLESDTFKQRIYKIIEYLIGERAQEIIKKISITTAHRSKGREADTVIILDATDHQFPKEHSDNLLFKIFGVTPSIVLNEERRLFYVAITRAKHNLYILTEKDHESPFIFELANQEDEYLENSCNTKEPHLFGSLAKNILRHLNQY